MAILLWGTTVALMRSVTEAFGQLGGASATYVVAGGLGLARLAFSRERRQRIRRLPAKYLLGCGAAVATYVFAIFMAFGRAHDRQQSLEVGLVNYLWPSLTILFSVLLLHVRARGWLLPGTLLCLTGIYLGVRPSHGSGLAPFLDNLGGNPAAYALALLAAAAWALYSTLARRWARAADGGGTDAFLAVTGILLAAANLLFGVHMPAPSARAAFEAAFLGAATYASYGLWDHAMRRGNMLLVAIASYFTPLLSMAVAVFYLGVRPPTLFWAGCALLVAGSLLSWWSVRGSDPTVSGNPPPAP